MNFKSNSFDEIKKLDPEHGETLKNRDKIKIRTGDKFVY